MEKRLCIKISEKDNVAVAIYDLKKGTEVMPGVVTAVDIPQAHKIALKEMKEGDPVYRYGVLLGHVTEDIPLGGWINEKNLVMAPAPDLDSLRFMQNIVTDLPKPERTTWMGYRNPLKEAVEAGDGQAVKRAGVLCPAGTRNILAINTTVQCVTDYDYTAFKLGPTFAKDPAQQLYVNPNKYADLNSFIEAAKANPGALKACTEVGAYTYYELLAFENLAGIDLDLVDVGSNSDKITAMLSEQVDLMPGAYINCKDYLESGQFACIGAPTAERYELIADIPTLKEQGIDLVYPDCDFSFYFPKDTSDDVIAWYEWIVQEMESQDACLEAIKNVEMMPYYLSAADSEANDKAYKETFQSIADTVK